jgi:hypothetical protein
VAHRWRDHAGPVLRLGLTATAVMVLGLGYGVWVALEGPHHIDGPAQTQVAIAGLSADPAGLVVPTSNQHFSWGDERGDSYVAQRDASWHVVADATAENGTYVGLPLLVLLVVGLVLLRRNRLALFAAAMAVAALVLSMGSTLHVDGHRTGVPLPFAVLAHLPLLDSAVASRYAVYFWLFAALLLTLTLDRLFGLASRWRPPLATLACLFVAVGSLLPLVPAWPYPAASAAVPPWFTTHGRALPTGATVVVYPTASPADASAMVWQASADMTFKMPGGYAVFASPPTGVASFDPAPSPVLDALDLCHAGETPSVTPEQTRATLRQWDTAAVVVAPGTVGAPCATHLFDQALGTHRLVGGVLVWSVPR